MWKKRCVLSFNCCSRPSSVQDLCPSVVGAFEKVRYETTWVGETEMGVYYAHAQRGADSTCVSNLRWGWTNPGMWHWVTTGEEEVRNSGFLLFSIIFLPIWMNLQLAEPAKHDICSHSDHLPFCCRIPCCVFNQFWLLFNFRGTVQKQNETVSLRSHLMHSYIMAKCFAYSLLSPQLNNNEASSETWGRYFLIDNLSAMSPHTSNSLLNHLPLISSFIKA